jgi:LuxR family transcriptional regulator, glucitol operon activator
MLGYGLWVAIEDTLRNWLSKRLAELYGIEWQDQFPVGIWNRLHERYNTAIKPEDFSHIRQLLEHSDFPDIFDIVRYKKQLNVFLPDVTNDDLEYYNQKHYSLRNQIAHKPYSFTIRSLDDLIGCAEWIVKILGPYGIELQAIIKGIQQNPEAYAQEIPEEFILSTKPTNQYKIPNNLPPMDYEYDGGFVGRRNERQELKKKLLNKRIFPIITLSGAGGVGKTALAHHVCDEVLRLPENIFDALIWISAKKDRLTVTGIEDIEPTAQSYEEVLNAILSTFGFDEYLQQSVEAKNDLIRDIILDSAEKGILLVVDNLETILHDSELVEFIKEIPLPNKVLITSRLGLGEIEKREPLKEMASNDAIELFRRIAIEKSVRQLAQLPNETIKAYVERMSAYPLVIKWVIGQAAINKDIERLVRTINSTESDISKFCFEYIYEQMLSENAKNVLLCLASSEEDLTQAALMHVVDLNVQEFEDVMLELELASLVVPDQRKDPNDQRVVTKYGILPLTKAYLISRGESRREIRDKLQSIQNLIEDSQRARRMYELSLEYYGADNESELIASKHIATAFTRNQAGDYLGALDALKRAEEIAPTFSTIFRSRAVIESINQNYEAAVEMFEKAIRLRRDDPITWFHWGKLEKELINYDSSRQKLTKALELVENKPSVLIELGNVETRASNFNKAIEYYNIAIKALDGDDSAITDRDLIIVHTALAKAYSRWAEVYEHDRQIEMAIEKALAGYAAMMTIATYGSSDTKTIETETMCLILLGRLYRKVKNTERAKYYLQSAVDQGGSSRIWSRKQKSYYIRACYYLILVITEEINYDLEQVRRIYQKGSVFVESDRSFADKFNNLKYLFDDKERFEGKFIRIIDEKGYGFIECPKADPNNVFAHISEIVDEVNDISSLLGVWVSFSYSKDGKKGPSAKAIKILPY